MSLLTLEDRRTQTAVRAHSLSLDPRYADKGERWHWHEAERQLARERAKGTEENETGMVRRIITTMLLCALAFAPAACVISDGTAPPTSQPADSESATIRWYLDGYKTWRDRADLLAHLALGPSPDPKKVKEYKDAVAWRDWFEETLRLWGVAVPK